MPEVGWYRDDGSSSDDQVVWPGPKEIDIGAHPVSIHDDIIVREQQKPAPGQPDAGILRGAETYPRFSRRAESGIGAAPFIEYLRGIVGRAVVDYEHLKRDITMLPGK